MWEIPNWEGEFVLELRWKTLAWRAMLSIGLYQIGRIVFFAFSYTTYTQFHWLEILKAFIFGLRFDAFMTAWGMLPTLVFWMLFPRSWILNRWLLIIDRTVFVLITVIFTGANWIDVEFYRFTGKRLSPDIFSIKQDLSNQVLPLLGFYWPMVLAVVVSAILLFVLSGVPKKSREGSSLKRVFAVYLPLAAVWVLAARGGWQLKPIRPVHAFFQGSAELGSLTLNSAFSLVRSPRKNLLGQKSFFVDGELAKWLNSPTAPAFAVLKKPNVVLFILESFSLEYMGWPDKFPGYMPFLGELAGKGIFFPHFFANGRRSIDALPSIICAIPDFMSEAFVTSNYQGQNIHCLGEILAKSGYSAQFFHGAQNGSMYIDSFARRAGFQFFGLNEYPYPGDRDGHWGVFDGPFLTFMAEEIKKLAKPFVSVFFSLTSHNPYRIPSDRQGRYPKGTLDIHESLGYTDEVLKEFFQAVQNEDWFSNTVFIVTADHTSVSEKQMFQNASGLFRVPLIVYAPGTANLLGGALPPNEQPKTMPKNPSGGSPLDRALSELNPKRFAQHVDIPSTILDIVGVSPKELPPFGTSLFSKNQGRVFNRDSSGFWIQNEEGFLHINHEGQLLRAHLQKQGEVGSETWGGAKHEQALAEIRAVVQFYYNGIVTNSWLNRAKWGFAP